jgi:hypothetical protein
MTSTDTLLRFISNWCVAAGCLLVALPTVLAVTEPTVQEARGDYLSEDQDRPGAQAKKEAAEKHAELVNVKTVEV